MFTAECPLCGCVHNVLHFDGKESEEQRCMSCSGGFHFVRPSKAGADFTTRVANRMNQAAPE